MLASVKKCEGGGIFAGLLVHYAMRLTKRTIGFLIAIAIISLLGIMGIQLFLLKNAYEQKEQAFRQTVDNVLAAVNDGLETNDAVSKVFAVSIPRSLGKRSHAFVTMESNLRVDSTSTLPGVVLRDSEPELPMKVSGTTISYSVQSPQHVSIRVFDMLGREDTTIVDTFRWAGEYNVDLHSPKYSRGQYFYKYSTDSLSMIMQVMHGSSGGVVEQGVPGLHQEKIVREVVGQMTAKDRPPIEKRIQKAVLDSLIRTNLQEAGIDLPYEYAVTSSSPESLRIVSAHARPWDLQQSEFRARLFPSEMFLPRNDLVLYFPDRNIFLLRSMAPLVGATLLFMVGISFAFVYTTRTIFKQKRLSELMVEFINNMTHEFKTPISTIALASEAIARPDVLPDGERVLRYNEIIHDENARMKGQVDKILQMAVLEEGDYELNIAPLDIHEVIDKAVGNIALQVEGKGGTIDCTLSAGSHVIAGDAVHITNIIHNLLDNANKYSPGRPLITISTRNADGFLIVSVKDNGIGMNDEDARRVFDKYFRVPTGNMHNVKGFGLGLSYVKLMVDAHRGKVNISSSPGKGTTVEVMFPLGREAGETHS